MPERPSEVLMVVDDDVNARELERAILERAGYQVLRANNGFQALALVEPGTAIDLLVADSSMPDMDGAEMVRQIRAMRSDLKILYVTGFIDRSHKRAALGGRSLPGEAHYG